RAACAVIHAQHRVALEDGYVSRVTITVAGVRIGEDFFGYRSSHCLQGGAWNRRNLRTPAPDCQGRICTGQTGCCPERPSPISALPRSGGMPMSFGNSLRSVAVLLAAAVFGCAHQPPPNAETSAAV